MPVRHFQHRVWKGVRYENRNSQMYYKGQGVAIDRIEAAKWWTLAMLKGGEFAEMVRRSVESAEAKLTPEEIADGKRRAAEWIEARKGKK